MSHYFSIALFFILIFGIACNTNPKAVEEISETPKLSPIEIVEKAHKKSRFLENSAVQFDIVLSFGGTERLNGTVTLASNSSQGLYQMKDSSEILFINDRVYYSDPEKNPKSIRFAAYTWSYFFLFPHKLSDPGTVWSEKEQKELNGKKYDFQKLTFEAGTGDAPDDWYLMYSDPENNLIEFATYIVTAGSSQAEAEKDPHAIQYTNYEKVGGVPFAKNWIFWEWRETEGLTKELGNAQLSNFSFIEEGENLFNVKEGFLLAE